MNKEANSKSPLHLVRQKPLLWIILLSVSLRIAVAFYMGNQVVELPGIFDQISYHNLALRVLGGHGFSFGEQWWPITPADAPTAHWSFLYTLYLVAVYAVFGPHPLAARVLQSIIVGVLHPYITYRFGEKLFGRTAGLIAAGITAVYAYFFYYGAALMTEPFYITAILVSLFLATQLAENSKKAQDAKLGLALGLSLGITILLRQVFLLFVPFLFLWIWMSRIKRTPSTPLRASRSLPIASTAISVLMVAIFILPVSLYNQSRFGRFVLLNTNSGYAFFWGNHPIYGTKFIPILPTGMYQDLIPEDVRYLDEAALDQELLGRGMQFVMSDPMRYVQLSLSRIPAYFMFWPSSESSTVSNISRMASFGVMWPFMLAGLVLGLRITRIKQGNRLLGLLLSSQGLILIFALVYTGIHLLTWALIRYRLPVDAVLIPFAGLALAALFQRFVPVKQLSVDHKRLENS